MRRWSGQQDDQSRIPLVEGIGVTTKKTIVRREGVGIRAVVRVTGEGGGGGQIQNTSRLCELQVHRWGLRSLGCHRLLPGPPPPNFQVLPEVHIGRSDSSGAGASGWTDS